MCDCVCAHFSVGSCSFSVVHVDRISSGFMCSSFVLLKQHKIQKNQRNDLSRRSVVVSISCIVGIPHPNLNMLYHHHHHHHRRCRLLVRFTPLSMVGFLFILYHFSLVSFHALWCVCMARAHFVCNNKSKILFNTMIVFLSSVIHSPKITSEFWIPKSPTRSFFSLFCIIFALLYQTGSTGTFRRHHC